MIDSAVFIGAIIIAVTQAVKYLAPKAGQLVTMIIAVLAGILVALVDTNIGVGNITIAQGIMTALAAVGVHTVAKATSSNS